MSKGYREVNEYQWLKLSGKTVIAVGDKWQGKVLIACYVDIILISEEQYKRYNSCIIGQAKLARVVFV